jgi:ribosomal small subunit protein bTHX
MRGSRLGRGQIISIVRSPVTAAITTSRIRIMGKGDRKTAKGKRYNASYGKARPKSAPVKKMVAKKAV